MDRIRLDDLRFDAIVGVLPSEQTAAQPLVLDVELWLDLDKAGSTGDLSLSVDYAGAARQIRFMAQHGRWRLIESLGTAICRLLLAPPAAQEARAQVARCEVTIAKPTILGGLAVPSVTLRRTAEWCRLTRTEAPSRTTLERLEQTAIEGAYRVHVEGGTAWTPPPSVALHVIAGRPRVRGETLNAGDEVARHAGAIENHQKLPVTLLAVGAPLQPV